MSSPSCCPLPPQKSRGGGRGLNHRQGQTETGITRKRKMHLGAIRVKPQGSLTALYPHTVPPNPHLLSPVPPPAMTAERNLNWGIISFTSSPSHLANLCQRECERTGGRGDTVRPAASLPAGQPTPPEVKRRGGGGGLVYSH